MDTGIYAAHDEFLHGTGPTGTGTTRVEAGIDYVNDGTSATNPCAPAGQWYTGTNPHGAGHGTSVASILGGRLYGVAKEVILTPVRVFGCGGGADTTRFLNGLNWIRTHYAADNKPALINVSGYVLRIDPGISNADRDAIEVSVGQTIAAGITVISSANNRNEDACWTSPAHIPGVITVGGSMRNTVSGTLTDTSWISPDPVWSDANRDPGTNWGGCVDIFAPAHDLRSADVTSSTAYRTTDTSGTSFASPHVAGAVARYLQGRFKAPNNPGLAWSFIDGNSWKGIMADNFDNPLNGSPNKLLSVLPTY